MAYLSIIDLHNHRDMSVLLTRLVDRTNPLVGGFFEWIGTGDNSFFWGIYVERAAVHSHVIEEIVPSPKYISQYG